MKRYFILAAAASLAVAGASLLAQSAPDISYDANADALSLPANTYLGEVAGRRGDQLEGPRVRLHADRPRRGDAG
jgi:hypothetical protein